MFTVSFVFQPSRGGTDYQIDKIESTDGACNAYYDSPNRQPPADNAWCNVTATNAKQNTITPHWIIKPR
jgi:hypothetical protein